MEQALADGGVTVDDIDAVIAHGTATWKGDEAEIRALNRLFGNRDAPVPVVSLKGHMGHNGGAAGCMNVIAAALTLQDDVLAHTAGTTDPDPEITFDLVMNEPRPLRARNLLVNAFGFGGQNASLVVGRV
jgi:3-oxoacyl-[acyl-carrier-protein] synthase II